MSGSANVGRRALCQGQVVLSRYISRTACLGVPPSCRDWDVPGCRSEQQYQCTV